MHCCDDEVLAAYKQYQEAANARAHWRAVLLRTGVGGAHLSRLTARTKWPLTVSGAFKHIYTARKKARAADE